MSRTIRTCSVLALASLTMLALPALMAPVSAQQSTGATGVAAPTGRGLVMQGDEPDFFMLYTGDVIGYLDTCGCKRNPAGGLARRAWVLDRLDDLFPSAPRLLVDSGNFSDLPTAQGDLKTQALIEAMGTLGYHAANVGERDLKTGYADFAKRTAGAKFPFLSSNIVREDTGKPVFQPHHVVELERNGKTIKIGLIGVARHNQVFLKAGPDDSNMIIAPAAERVAAEVAALKAKGVDLIVLLAALHKQDASEILEANPEIRFVVGAYGGVFTTREEKAGEGWLLYSGNQGKRLGETRVYLDKGKSLERQLTTMHFLTRLYPADQEMLDYVNAVPIDDNSRTVPASAQ